MVEVRLHDDDAPAGASPRGPRLGVAPVSRHPAITAAERARWPFTVLAFVAAALVIWRAVAAGRAYDPLTGGLVIVGLQASIMLDAAGAACHAIRSLGKRPMAKVPHNSATKPARQRSMPPAPVVARLIGRELRMVASLPSMFARRAPSPPAGATAVPTAGTCARC